MNSEYTPPDTTIRHSTDGKVKTLHPHSNLSAAFNPYIILCLQNENQEQQHASNMPLLLEKQPIHPNNIINSSTPPSSHQPNQMVLEGGPHRVEKDSFGNISIPSSAYWSTSTQRCLNNFNINPALDFIKQSHQSPIKVFLLTLLIIKKAVCLTHLHNQVKLHQDTSATTEPKPFKFRQFQHNWHPPSESAVTTADEQVLQSTDIDAIQNKTNEDTHVRVNETASSHTSSLQLETEPKLNPAPEDLLEIIPMYKLLAMIWAIEYMIHTPQILVDHFPLPIIQTGSLTHLHMNINEVIATIANQVVVDAVMYCFHTGQCFQIYSTNHSSPEEQPSIALLKDKQDLLESSSIDSITFYPLSDDYRATIDQVFSLLPPIQRDALLSSMFMVSSISTPLSTPLSPILTSTTPFNNSTSEDTFSLTPSAIFKCIQPVESNDDVNACQSTNCVIPTATRMTILFSLDLLLEQLYLLTGAIQTLAEQDNNHHDVLKIGRTHMQVATPIRLYDEIMSFYYQLTSIYRTLINFVPNLLILPIGGTAVGTGVNSYEGFDLGVCDELSKLCGKEFESTTRALARPPSVPMHDPVNNSIAYPFATETYLTSTALQHGKRLTSKYELMSSINDEVMVSGMLSTLAACLSKFGQDVRFLSSPGSGCSGNDFLASDDNLHILLSPEYHLKQLESGSSIMPNKSNPTQIEALLFTCQRVISNHFSILQSNTLGQLQFNAMRPAVLTSLLESIELLTHSMSIFNAHCISLLTFNTEMMNSSINHSLMISTLLTPILGYKYVSTVVKRCVNEKSNLWDVLIQDGIVTSKDDFFTRFLHDRQQLVQPVSMEQFITQRHARIKQFEEGLSKDAQIPQVDAMPFTGSHSVPASSHGTTHCGTSARGKELINRFHQQQVHAHPSRSKQNPLDIVLDDEHQGCNADTQDPDDRKIDL